MLTDPNQLSAPPSLLSHDATPAAKITTTGVVTVRAFGIGLLLAAALAALNAWLENVANVHFLGGVHMPFGAVFSLAFFVLFLNGPLKWLCHRTPALGRFLPPFSATELLTIYAMMTFAALVSTPGCDNFTLTIGPGLFYYSTRENGWANMFYSHIPRHFAPGWDGQTFQSRVIEPFYLGGLSPSQIPWHAWTLMLVSWGLFALLLYSALFFVSLLLRKQWIENEALTFPLVQLPLQMVNSGSSEVPPAREFWSNRLLWMGVALATVFHLVHGLNNYSPDWPQIATFQGNAFRIESTEAPWNSAGVTGVELFFGAIGIAYLLTRELSFSFWFYFVLFKLQLVAATIFGFPVGNLPKDTYLGRPAFLTWQSVGGWIMLAVLLLWSARGHLLSLWREAWHPRKAPPDPSESLSLEPFSARFVFLGLGVSILGLMGWCWFSGLNLFATLTFFGLYSLTSLVLARLVIEGGFLYPQATFAPLEILTGSVMGAGAMGADTLTKLSFLQPPLFSDMRSNLLPGFLHTLKIAHELKLEGRQIRRLMGCALVAIVAAWAVSTYTTIVSIYAIGGLGSYKWFTQSGPQSVFKGTATMISTQPGVSASNWGWLLTGAAIVWCLTFARARFFWFPLHPLAFIVSTGYPISRLWLSFFIGWATKSLLLKYGGHESAQQVRPFMIGLILGNAAAMVLWMIYGFFAGSQIQFWPA